MPERSGGTTTALVSPRFAGFVMAQTESKVTVLADASVRVGRPLIAQHRRQSRQLQPPSETRPELWAAVTGGVVTLDQLIEARRLGRARADARDRIASSYYWPLLLDPSPPANGRLVEHFFAKQIDAAAVLTDQAELRMTYSAENVMTVQPEFEEALWRAAALVRQAMIMGNMGEHASPLSVNQPDLG
jgi:hypothetical protein